MAKPIYTAEIDDSAFKQFYAIFEQYKAEMAKVGEEWGLTGDKVNEIGGAIAVQTVGMLAQAKVLHDQQRAFEEQVKREKELNDIEDKRSKRFQEMYRTSVQFARQMGSVTLDLLKWTGFAEIIGGIIGAGGLWGLDQLANSVAGQRRTALGLGVTTGEKTALDVNYQQYIDVPQTLEAVAEAKAEPSKWWEWSTMGISNWRNKSNADLAIEVLEKGRQAYINTGGSEPLLKSRGFTDFMTMDRLRELSLTDPRDLADRRQHFGEPGSKVGDRYDFNIGPEMARQWVNFSRAMAQASMKIETSLIGSLTDLTPELSELSKEVSNFISSFLHSDEFHKWIKMAEDGLKDLGTYLESGKARDDFDRFVKVVGEMADHIEKILEQLGWVTPPAPTTPAEKIKADKEEYTKPDYFDPYDPTWLRKMHHQKVALDAAHKVLKARGWDWPDQNAIIAEYEAESGMNPFNYTYSKNGLQYGIGMWSPDRQKDFLKLFGHTMASVRDPMKALGEELAFGSIELTDGKYKKVGDKIKKDVWENSKIDDLTHLWMTPYLKSSPHYASEDANRHRIGATVAKANVSTTVTVIHHSPPGWDANTVVKSNIQ